MLCPFLLAALPGLDVIDVSPACLLAPDHG